MGVEYVALAEDGRPEQEEGAAAGAKRPGAGGIVLGPAIVAGQQHAEPVGRFPQQPGPHPIAFIGIEILAGINVADESAAALDRPRDAQRGGVAERDVERRSEEHTSELQSLMRISYAVFCLKKKKE